MDEDVERIHLALLCFRQSKNPLTDPFVLPCGVVAKDGACISRVKAIGSSCSISSLQLGEDF